MHGFPGTDTIVEEDGHIGHGAILHGCIVRRNALVGMNAVVNDNAVVGESSIVAAMAFVKAGMMVPPRTLVGRRAGEDLRELSEQEMIWKIEANAELPGTRGAQPGDHDRGDPLDAVEPDRRRIEVPELLPLSNTKRRESGHCRVRRSVSGPKRSRRPKSPRPDRRAAGRKPRHSRPPLRTMILPGAEIHVGIGDRRELVAQCLQSSAQFAVRLQLPDRSISRH